MFLYGKKWKLLIFWKLLLPVNFNFVFANNQMGKWSYMSIQGQGHSFTLDQGHSDVNIKT